MAGIVACSGKPTDDTAPVANDLKDAIIIAITPPGPANNNSPVVSGTAGPNFLVKLFSDSFCTTEIASGSAGSNQNFAIAISVPDNSTTTVYGQSFDGTNWLTCSTSSVTYVEDSAAPALPLVLNSSPTSPANNNNPTINGTAEANSSVELFSDSSCSISLATGAASGSGNFAIAISVANNSTTTIYARATDAAGNASGCSTSFVSYVEDSGIPAEPVVLSSTPVSPANNNTPVINGTAEPSSSVTLYSDSSCTTSLATGPSDGSGNFAISISVSNDSTTTVYAKVFNGTAWSACSSTSVTYVEDSTAPSLPVVASSTPASPANNNNPVINGTTEASASITLYSNSSCTTLLTTGTADGSGNYSIAIAVSDNTTTTIYAKASDAAGNTSGCSTSFVSYVEDSIAPSVPVVVSSTPTSPANNNNPTIGGTADVNTAITLYSNSSCTTLLTSGTSDGSGNFSIPISVTDNTTTTVYAKATDTANNSSACSSTFVTYIEDSAGPSLPVVISSTPASPANNNNPTVNGTAEANSSVELFSDSSCTTSLATGTANGSGNFSIAISVADNSTTTVYAKSTDGTGNPSGCSTTSVTYIEDSIAPTLPVVSSTTPTSPANNNNPTVNGTAEANASVTLYSDSSCTGSLSTSSADGSGNYSIAIAVSDNTTTTIYAKASDAAGNTSGCSTTFVSYTEDSSAPTMPVVSGVTPTSPANNNSPTITGTADANITVTLYSNSSCTTLITTGTADGAGNFSIGISVADNTATTVYAKATDSANNSSACSTTFVTYVEDSAAPTAPTLSSSTPASPANNNSPTINGTTEANASVELFSDSSCTTSLTTGTANGSGNFSIGISVTDNTTTSVYGKATDAAGNASTCSLSFVNYVEDSLAPTMPIVLSSTPTPRSEQTTFTVNGTAEASATLAIHDNSSCTSQVGTGSVDGSGNFAISVIAPVNVTKTYYAIATDAAGNTSACSTTNVSYEAYTIADGLAFLSGTQTTAGATPTNLNQGTAYSIQWPTAYVDETYYTHSVGANEHQLKINVAGDYRVSVNIPITAAVTNASVRAEVRVNGAVNTSSRASSYNSNSSGNTEGSINLTILVPGLAVNDVIDVTVIQAGNTGTATVTGQATLFAEYIDSTRTIFTATATRTTNSTNLNQATAYSLQWTEGIKDSGYTHSDASNSENITLDSIGDYIVYVNIPLSGAVTNANVKALVQLNGATVTGGEAKQGYIANSNGVTQSSLHWSGIVRSTAVSQILTVKTQIEGNSGTITVPAGYVASIFVEKLSTTNNLFYGYGNQLVSGTNFNPNTASQIQWSTTPLKDTSVYTHSTATNSHQITIEALGDYLLSFNAMVTGTSARANQVVEIEVNGNAISGAQSKSFFIRNMGGQTEASSTQNYLLRNLSIGDVITLTSVREAATGTITNQNSSLVILKK